MRSASRPLVETVSFTGTPDLRASTRNAGARPPSDSTAGWIPRAISRTSLSAAGAVRGMGLGQPWKVAEGERQEDAVGLDTVGRMLQSGSGSGRVAGRVTCRRYRS